MNMIRAARTIYWPHMRGDIREAAYGTLWVYESRDINGRMPRTGQDLVETMDNLARFVTFPATRHAAKVGQIGANT